MYYIYTTHDNARHIFWDFKVNVGDYIELLVGDEMRHVEYKVIRVEQVVCKLKKLNLSGKTETIKRI